MHHGKRPKQRQTCSVPHFQSSGCSVVVPSHKEQWISFFFLSSGSCALNSFRRIVQTGPPSLCKHQPQYWPQRWSRPEKVLISPQKETNPLNLPRSLPLFLAAEKCPETEQRGERGDCGSGGRRKIDSEKEMCSAWRRTLRV